MTTGQPLTDLEKRILDFGGKTWRHDGNRDMAIREDFGLSATRYYQLLHGLLDRPEALAYAPATVKRHQRLRAQRQRERSLASVAKAR